MAGDFCGVADTPADSRGWGCDTYALSVTKFQANPCESHWKAVKNILKYLRRTKDLFLIYGGAELQVRGFTDASFQSDKDDCKSQSGYIFTLNGGAVSWKSSKHG